MLVCDPCYAGATGLIPECEDDCCKALDHDGLCLVPDSREDCEWCGCTDRLHIIREFTNAMPTVGEMGEGQFWLNWPRERQGPFPSAEAAWAHWHDSVL